MDEAKENAMACGASEDEATWLQEASQQQVADEALQKSSEEEMVKHTVAESTSESESSASEASAGQERISTADIGDLVPPTNQAVKQFQFRLSGLHEAGTDDFSQDLFGGFKEKAKRRHSQVITRDAPANKVMKERRMSLAAQAIDIKMSKFSENARKVEQSQPGTRRQSLKSDHSEGDSEESDAESYGVGTSSRKSKSRHSGDFDLPEGLGHHRTTSKKASSSGVASTTSTSMSINLQRRKSRTRPSSPGRDRDHTGTKRLSEGTLRFAHIVDPSRAGMIIEVSYPGLMPFWPAFTDVEFEAQVQCFALPKYKKGRSVTDLAARGEQMLPPEVGLLRYEISPELPASVSIDAETGTIWGSPMIEHVWGKQYTVTAMWSENNEVAAVCVINFAVVAADVAASCNGAYMGSLGYQLPAFQPDNLTALRGPPSAKECAPKEASKLPLLRGSTAPTPHHRSVMPAGAEEVHSHRLGCNGNGPGVTDVAALRAPLAQHVITADEPQEGSLAWAHAFSWSDLRSSAALRDPSPSAATRQPSGLSRSPPSSRSTLGIGTLPMPWVSGMPGVGSRACTADGKSRTNVFPLGPPLREEQPMKVSVFACKPPLSARGLVRPRMRALY